MSDIHILWVDDEIELLKPNILFLEKRGYQVGTATNADDALDMMEQESYDLIFLDENMPGLSGLDALSHFKQIAPTVPIVMVTKSEEENIMDRAVGAKIADYLIKPVNPNQMLISIKKHLHEKALVKAGTTSAYQSDYSAIADLVDSAQDWEDWASIHRKLSEWRLSLLDAKTPNMLELHGQQLQSANSAFGKYIKREYAGWFAEGANGPLTSPRVLRERVFPSIDAGEHVLLVVIDNLRYDQWRVLRSALSPQWQVEREEMYYAILPTVTQYARNALFAGLMPLAIERLHPDLWVGELDPEGKNVHEFELLTRNFQRLGKNYRVGYYKGTSLEGTPLGEGDLSPLTNNDLTVVVYNFVDMLSHARSDMQIVKQLASDANAYLSLTRSWFEHSDLYRFLLKVCELPVRLMITTDHGSIQVRKPLRVVGDRESSTNIRYKMGKNLAYDERAVYDVTQPATVHLPQNNVSSRFIFALGEDYFIFPKNFNAYVRRYRDTFQHGGVSLEEMIVPFASMRAHK